MNLKGKVVLITGAAVRVGRNRGVVVLFLRGRLVSKGGTRLDLCRRGTLLQDRHLLCPFAGPSLFTFLYATRIVDSVHNGGAFCCIPCSVSVPRTHGVIHIF